MNITDAYAVVDYRTLCGSGRLDTVPPHSKTVNKILIWDTHLVTDSMWLESEQRFEYVPDKDSRVYTPAEFTLNYYRGTNMDGRLVLSSMKWGGEAVHRGPLRPGHLRRGPPLHLQQVPGHLQLL